MTRAVFVLPVRLRHLFDGCMEETSTPPIQSTNVQVTTPRSSNLADRESPGSTGMGSLHVPVVMKSPYFQSDVDGGEFIDQPGQRGDWVAEHVPANALNGSGP